MTGGNERPNTGLTAEEAARYARQIVLPEIGPEGQRHLKRARVLVVGAGGLGSPAALYLAAAGVGALGIIDPDFVEVSNLQRQVLHDMAWVNRPKADSARARLEALNPLVRVEVLADRLVAANARDILTDFDVVVDGSDNFPTRYLLNDACVMLGLPLVHGSVDRFRGQASVFHALRGPCYRCLFPTPPPAELAPNCAEAGVLGVLPGLIGMIQATEALKLILGTGEPLLGRLLVYDALAMRFHELRVPKDPACPMCGVPPAQRRLVELRPTCPPAAPGAAPGIAPAELQAALRGPHPPLVLDVRSEAERRLGALAGSVWIPMDQVQARLAELPAGRDIVVCCRSGARSARVTALLRAHGFPTARNLAGGLHAWARDIDPSLSRV